jgi:hypothetical protein
MAENDDDGSVMVTKPGLGLGIGKLDDPQIEDNLAKAIVDVVRKAAAK